MAVILFQYKENIMAKFEKLEVLIMDNYTRGKNSNMSLGLWGIDGRSPIVSIMIPYGLVSASLTSTLFFG